MTVVMLLLILAFFLSPFLGLGLRRAWRIAAIIWIPLTAYTAFVLTRPMPLGADEQDVMGGQAWQLILLILVVGGLLSFVAGFGISVLRARSQPNKSKEATE
jgi:hypothetical protein